MTHEATSAGDRDATRLLSPRAGRRLLIAVAGATFIVTLSTTSLAVAVPAVSRALRAAPLQSSLVVVVPQLMSTVLLLPFGVLGDRLGRRRCYLTALAVFTVATALLGASPDIWFLIGMQVAQAAGVAAIWANSAALLFESLDGRRFRNALGLYIASISLADLAGPTIGGLITGSVGWRWIFGFTALVGFACLLRGMTALPRHSSKGRAREFDAGGAVLLVVGLTGVIAALLSVQSSAEIGWQAAVAATGGVLVLAAFVRREKTVREPLLDVRLFRTRRLGLAVAASVLNAAAQWVPSLLLVLYFQARDSDSAVIAGLLVMPLSVSAALSSLLLGMLSTFLGSDRLALVGSLAGMAGLVAIAADVNGPYIVLALALILLGSGSGVFSAAIADVLIHETSHGDVGAVNGTRLTAQNLGWVIATPLVLGVATAGLTLRGRRDYFTGRVQAADPGAAHLLSVGYHVAFAVLAAFAAIATASAWSIVRLAGRRIS